MSLLVDVGGVEGKLISNSPFLPELNLPTFEILGHLGLKGSDLKPYGNGVGFKEGFGVPLG